MKYTLALRVSRRAIGAAALSDESMVFRDGRFLRSNREAAVKAAVRYVAKLVDLTQPKQVVIDGPTTQASTCTQILDALTLMLTSRRLPSRILNAATVVASYGTVARITRIETRRTVEEFWPLLSELKGQIKPYVADAAAAALYAETAEALGLFAPP